MLSQTQFFSCVLCDFQADNETNGSNRLLFDELFGLASSSSIDADDDDDEVLRNCSCRKFGAPKQK
jgi:hypothetical protein